MPDYYVIPTNIGEAKMANALALGIPLAITELALGDGEGTGARGTPLPNPEATGLVSERRRAPVNSFSVDPDNDNVLIAEQVIPETAGGWWIREMGLFDEDGDLIFLCNTPPTYKPQLSEGSGRTQVVRMASIVSDTAAVTLKVDPSVVLATRKYVEDELVANVYPLEAAIQKRVIFVNSVVYSVAGEAEKSLRGLDVSKFSAGQQLHVLSFHPPVWGLASFHGGGIFVWDPDSTEMDDGGYVIKAEGSASGRFFRLKESSSEVNASEYGAKAEVGYDNAPAINAALSKHPHVVVGTGEETLLIESAIRIPSNRKLEFHPGMTLKLADGANSYLITNDDLVNGNENIRIIGNGATIDGNKAGGQIRDYGAPADDRASYWGFGFWLVRVTNLEVRDFYIFETEAWGVAYWSVDNAYFGNIEFSQETTGGSNGDGVTGVGNNILIENIFGYTNDDMIAIATGGGTLGGNDMGMPQLAEIRNITIRNIKPQVKNGNASWRAVRATGRSPDGGTTPALIFGLTIQDVRGYTRQSIVDISNFWPEDPGFTLYHVILENIEREYYPTDVDTTYAHITIDECKIEDLTIRDWRAFDASEIPDFCTISSTAKIGRLKLEGCEFIDEVSSGEKALVKDAGEVHMVLISNCTGLRRNVPGSVADGRIYFKTNTSAPKTLVRFSSSYVERNYTTSPNSPFDCAEGAALSVSGTSDVAKKSRLTPEIGDVIIDTVDLTVETWNGTAWV